MREIKTKEYSYGLIVTVAGLSLYSFYVRELLASLALFSAAFFVLAVVVFGVFLAWLATEQMTLWFGPASRNVIAFSRRLIALRNYER